MGWAAAVFAVFRVVWRCQVAYCTSQFAVDAVPNTGSYSWTVPTTIDDTLAYRVFLRDPVTRVETNSSLFYVTPYLRTVPTR